MNRNVTRAPAQEAACWLLTLLWCAGVLAGAFWVWYHGELWTAGFPHCAAAGLNPAGALTAAVGPMLVSAAMYVLLGRHCIWFLGPVRGFLMGVAAAGIGLCWGTGGPMMAVLLLFSGLFSAPLQLLLWHRFLRGGVDTLWRETGALIGMAVLIAAADYWIVSPFLVEVLNF